METCDGAALESVGVVVIGGEWRKDPPPASEEA